MAVKKKLKRSHERMEKVKCGLVEQLHFIFFILNRSTEQFKMCSDAIALNRQVGLEAVCDKEEAPLAAALLITRALIPVAMELRALA